MNAFDDWFDGKKVSLWTRVRLFFKKGYVAHDPAGEFYLLYKYLNGRIYVVKEWRR